MQLKELKKKVLRLIEEYDSNSELLTADPDISAKINDVINQVIFELARIKKIPKYFEMEVKQGDLVTFSDFEKECGYEVFQADVSGVQNVPKANGTVFKIEESGVLEVDCYVYPERITDKTKDTYELELSQDALEIAPYGIAADLLKSDVSSEYGTIYATRYENMKQMLDPRYSTGKITFTGGINI